MTRTIALSTAAFVAAAVFSSSAVAADAVDTAAQSDATTAAAVAGPETAAPEKGAMETFKASHEAVLALVKSRASEEKLAAEVDAFLDYKWIAQASLGGPKRYEKKCETRCADFEARLAELIRRNYLDRLKQADNGSIEYLGEQLRKNGTRAKVDTRVKFKKDGKEQTLDVSYVMHLVDNKWVARNIITDKVSMERTYKYDFASILRDSGIDGLITQLDKKLAELARRSVETKAKSG